MKILIHIPDDTTAQKLAGLLANLWDTIVPPSQTSIHLDEDVTVRNWSVTKKQIDKTPDNGSKGGKKHYTVVAGFNPAGLTADNLRKVYETIRLSAEKITAAMIISRTGLKPKAVESAITHLRWAGAIQSNPLTRQPEDPTEGAIDAPDGL